MLLRHIHLYRDVRPSPEVLLFHCVRMAESGSSRCSSETDDEYDTSTSNSLSSEVIEELCLSGPSLERVVLPYRFEPELPPTDPHDDSHATTVSPETEDSPAARVGNTDW